MERGRYALVIRMFANATYAWLQGFNRSGAGDSTSALHKTSPDCWAHLFGSFPQECSVYDDDGKDQAVRVGIYHANRWA